MITTTKDLHKPVNQELKAAFKVCKELEALCAEMEEIFPEREYLIRQLKYALLTREHVMVHGDFGTGKSDLVHTFFNCFTDATMFSIGFNKFMTESSIFGIPDPKKMREEGEIWYRRDGSILNAHFAELDEILDANSPLLRTLLGLLNERVFKRGRQLESAVLHTAIASTNGDPKAECQGDHTLDAVIDRFIFVCDVKYLDSDESRRKMYAKFLNGELPGIRIRYEDLLAASAVVVSSCQIRDPEFIATYDQAIQAYREAVKGKQVVSDRRACKLLQICEAEALLHGRYDVDVEDILAVKYGLCEGGNEEQMAAFEDTVVLIVTKAKEEQAQNLDDVQLKLLEEYKQQLPTLTGQEDDGQLVQFKRDLHELKNRIEAVKPKLESTKDIQAEILAKTTSTQEAVETQLIEG